MKKLAFLGTLLFTCTPVVFAQSPDTTSRSAQQPDSNSQTSETDRTSNASGRQTSLVGCVMERNGKYMLMTKGRSNASSQTGAQSHEQSATQSAQSNTAGSEESSGSGTSGAQAGSVELIGTQDLKSHVGQKVRVTGTLDKMGTGTNSTGSTSSTTSDPSSNSSKRSQEDAMGRQDNMNRGTMRVTDVQMISQSCDRNGEKGSPRQ